MQLEENQELDEDLFDDEDEDFKKDPDDLEPNCHNFEKFQATMKVIDEIYAEDNDLEDDQNNGFDDDNESDSDYEDRSASTNRRRARKSAALNSSNDSHSHLSMT